jgi:hypothetical protein
MCVALLSFAGAARADRSAAVAKVCDKIAADTEALRHLAGEGYGDSMTEALAEVGLCHDAPNGSAWVVRAKRIPSHRPEDDFLFQAHVELVHIDKNGVVVARELPAVWEGRRHKAQPALAVGAVTNAHVLPLSVFDFDGDGEAEAFAGVEERPETSNADRRAALYAFVGKKVVPSPFAKDMRLDGVVDADGDGRPDLIYAGPYRGSAHACMSEQEGHSYVAPELILHSLPTGAFAADDEVARRFAAKSCAKTTPFALDPKRLVEDDGNAAMVVCARLRGVTTETITAALRKAYSATRNEDGQVCDDPATLMRWAKLPPPLSLSK